MLPSRTYRPEDLIGILRRKFWLILVPFAIVAAGTAVYARTMPDLYSSHAVLQVVSQRVPENYVRPTVTMSLAARLQSIRSLILSRTRLERLILELNLYSNERESGAIMEDLVERMRREVQVQTVQGDIFRVSYTGRDPRVVTAVAERLASMFIDESLRDRAVLAEGTDQFLESQLEEARSRLVEHEQRLEAYQRQFAGQLPSQLSANLQASQNLQTQIRTIVDSMDRDEERRLMFERQLAEIEAQAPVPGDHSGGALTAAEGGQGTATARLAAARKELAGLEARNLTSAHPDVRQAQRAIRDLEQQVDAEALAAPVSAGPNLPPSERARQRRAEELRGALDQLDRQTARNKTDLGRLRAAADGYQQRVEMVPTRETELVELTRDYGTLRATYTNLLSKKEEANISANLERLQAGEQFKILDPARVPQRPITDRTRIRVMGMLAGLGLGVCLVGLLEYFDSTFKTDSEVTGALALPVLAVVPVMASARERRRVRARRAAVWLVLGGTVAGCLAVVAYTLVR
jgi:polysaccharide chain length determinant protein (PEP-CTERM system associated)